MKYKRFKEIQKKYADKCIVHCSEYHAHSAQQGCVVPKDDDGDDKDVLICELCEEISGLHSIINGAIKDLKRARE